MDELQALKALYPPPEPPSASIVQRQREKLMSTIEATTSANPRRPGQWRRPRVLALIGVPVVAAALAAAGWAVLRDQPSDVASFACVTDGVTSILPYDGTPPVEACQAEWEAGRMVEGVTTAPPLAACVRSGTHIEVIEAESPDACERAGSSEWTDQGDSEAMASAINAVRISFHDRYNATGNGCATEQDWRTALAEQPGIDMWTIEADQVKPDRHCYDVGTIDPGNLTVTLIGFPSDFSLGCDPRTGC